MLGDFIEKCNGRNRRQILTSRHGMFKDANMLWRFALFLYRIRIFEGSVYGLRRAQRSGPCKKE